MLICRSQVSASIIKNFEDMVMISDADVFDDHSESVSTAVNRIKDDFDQLSDNSSIYPSFGGCLGTQLQPKFVEFTGVFPTFPKTHSEGYATVIELDDTVLNHKALLALKQSCQYSVTSEGHGYRLKNSPFFVPSSNSTDSMQHSRQQCAGVKACEFLAEELKVAHTEVDEERLLWAKLLAEQEKAEANTWDAKVLSLLDEYFEDTCTRYVPGSNQTCGGRTVIRSFENSSKYMHSNRLFIGCEKWKKGQADHTMIPLQHYDPIAVIQLWGKERCMIHKDIIVRLKLSDWFESDSVLSSISSHIEADNRHWAASLSCSICKSARRQKGQ